MLEWINSNSELQRNLVWYINVQSPATFQVFYAYTDYETSVQAFGWQDTSYSSDPTAKVNQAAVAQLLSGPNRLQAYSYLWQYAETWGFTS